MSSFDNESILVNCRSYFNNKLEIDLIDIKKKDKITKHRIPVNGSGILVSAKLYDLNKIFLIINWK